MKKIVKKEPEKVEVVSIVLHVTPRMVDAYQMGYQSALRDVQAGLVPVEPRALIIKALAK